jgi:hypothetical protein
MLEKLPGKKITWLSRDILESPKGDFESSIEVGFLGLPNLNG